MAALGVVTQLRDLASDPHNRRKIVQDQGCLPGLVLLVDHHEEEVVVTALEALKYLAECPSNRPAMKAELGMMFSLEEIMHKANRSNRAKMLARQVHQRLSTSLLSKPLHDSQNTCSQLNGGQKQPTRRSSAARPGKGFFLGTNSKNSRVVILQINGLKDQSCRKVCEEQLLRVKGVVSFTFDLIKCRCTLRVKKDVRTEALVAAIARTKTMFADQVTKDEHGEEVLLSFGPRPSLADKENKVLPDYLPEEDGPIEGLDKAVTKPGVGCEEREASWLSTAASFISNSFYW